MLDCASILFFFWIGRKVFVLFLKSLNKSSGFNENVIEIQYLAVVLTLLKTAAVEIEILRLELFLISKTYAVLDL